MAKGDVVGVYANASLANIIGFTLAYAWARATNNTANVQPQSVTYTIAHNTRGTVTVTITIKPIDYIVAYPTIPINPRQPIVIVAKWVKPRGLAIGPTYLKQLPQLIINVMKPINAPPTINGVIDPEDPCYAEYQAYQQQGASSPSQGVYSNGQSTLIWAAPMFYTGNSFGVPAYSDGNGTFYWDTCLAISNSFQSA